jgi:hypothetical protein
LSDDEELINRIETLESIERIKTLKARYFRLVHEKKHDEFAALFTPNAVIVTDGITWSSSTEMAETIRSLTGAAPSVHHGHMPEIAVSGDSARGIWAMQDLLTFPAADGAPEGHIGYGQYRETLPTDRRRVAHRQPHPDPLPDGSPRQLASRRRGRAPRMM